MEIYITEVKGSGILKNVRELATTWLGKSVRNRITEYSPAGIDSCPDDGMQAVVCETGTQGNPISLGYVKKDRTVVNKGEIKVYCSQNTNFSYVYCRNDSKMEVGGSANHMTRYEALETAYNQLKADHDAFIDLWTIFCAQYMPGPINIPFTTPLVHSTGNISPAKIDNVLTS